MTEDEIAKIRELLEEDYQHNIQLTKGLTNAEIAAIEKKYAFRFPPDLKALLQQFLPIGPSFPDWRKGSKKMLHEAWYGRLRVCNSTLNTTTSGLTSGVRSRNHSTTRLS